MRAFRTYGCIVVALAASVSAYGQTYELTEKTKDGDCCRVELRMQLTGEMKIKRNDALIPLKMSAAAQHTFVERALAVGAGAEMRPCPR